MSNTSANKHILVTGGTGSVGKPLTEALLQKGWQVSHLSRKPSNDPGVKTFTWDVPAGKIDEQCIEGVDTVIHLAGAGIVDKRWTDERKKELIDSRTKSIQLIYDLIKRKPNKINTIISAAAIGYYGDRGDELMTEESLPGEGFMPECCVAWEKAVDEGAALDLRILKYRTGVVLDKNGGALPQMAMPVKLFAGTPLGSGKQWIPWIHWKDAVDMYLFGIENDQLEGVFNMVAPNPVTNQQLMKAIAKELHRPLWPVKVPSLVYKLLMGEMSIVVLGSARVSPQKIEDAGFKFKHREITGCLNEIYGS